MYYQDLLKDWSPYHLEDYDYPWDCTPPFEVMLKKNHEPGFQEKLASFEGSNIQANKKKSVVKGKGKKTTPLEIVEVPKDVTMVDYEVTTLKWDFARSMMDLKGDDIADALTFCLIIVDHLQGEHQISICHKVIDHRHLGAICLLFHQGGD